MRSIKSVLLVCMVAVVCTGVVFSEIWKSVDEVVECAEIHIEGTTKPTIGKLARNTVAIVGSDDYMNVYITYSGSTAIFDSENRCKILENTSLLMQGITSSYNTTVIYSLYKEEGKLAVMQIREPGAFLPAKVAIYVYNVYRVK